MSNRTLAIIGCSLLAILLIRQEFRMDMLEEKIDEVIQTKEHVKYTKNDLDCLTRNIYYEAGVESQVGKFAVAHVTINRLKTGHWGDSICKVVYAKKQFSWTLAKKLPRPDSKLWAESESVARKVLAGHRVRGLKRSLYYHAVYITDPKWADPKYQSGQIGRHVFYNQARGSNLTLNSI
jgi:spore germination cell wall hydrolase CwlJ-like protein